MNNKQYFCKPKKKLKRRLALLLAALMIFSTMSFDNAAIYAFDESSAATYTQDSAPLIVNNNGQSQNTFVIGETFHITGQKKDASIQKAEVLYRDNLVASKEVSASGNGIAYDIDIDTENLHLIETDLNRTFPLIVRFVCSNRATEEIEIEMEVTAEAMIEKNGNVEYLATLADAFGYDSKDGNITLLSDVNATNTIGAIYHLNDSKIYSIDLNHHNITVLDGRAIFYLTKDTQLTIKGEGKIELRESTGGIFGGIFRLATNTATLNIEGGEYVSTGPVISTDYENTIHISGGTFTSTGSGSQYDCLFSNMNNSSLPPTYLKDMPAPGYCFVDAENHIISIGNKDYYLTDLYLSNVTCPVTVKKIDFEQDIVVTIPTLTNTYTYNGYQKTPEVTSVTLGGINLKESYDYKVTYANNTDAGEALVIVSGIGSIYSSCGSKSFPFTIQKSNLLYAEGTGIASGTYGAKLSELEISGLSVLAGGWPFAGTWKIEDDTIPDVGDTNSYTAVFIPESGGDNYETLTKKVTLSLSKAEGILTVPNTAFQKTYRDADFSLNCSTNGDGKISYASDNESVAVVSADGTVTIKGAGTATITVYLAEGTNYTGAKEQSVIINVAKAAAPHISPLTMKYIYTIGSNGSVSVDIPNKLPKDIGKTKYTLTTKDSNQILSNVSVDSHGVLSYAAEKNKAVGSTATITVLIETANYENTTFTMDIVITDKLPVELRADSNLSINGSSNLIYGQPISTLTWNPAVFVEQGTIKTVDGTLAWKDGSHIPDAKTILAEWIFTPDDSSKYETLTGTMPITVEKATPNTEIPTVNMITYHPSKTLESVELNGKNASWTVGGNVVDVQGRWSWKDASTIPTVGNMGYTAIFTPDDTDNYRTVECIVAVTVEKAVPYIITLPEAAKITYGNTLNTSSLTGGKVQYSSSDETVVAGSFAWKDGGLKPDLSDSNSTKYTIVFTPLDKNNYNTIETEISLTVEQPRQPEEPEQPDKPGNHDKNPPIVVPTTPTAAVSKAQRTKNELALNAKLKVSQTANKITVTWGKIGGADGYHVYVQQCGKKFTSKSIYSVNKRSTTKLTIKKVNGKKLNLKKNYKLYVIAYKLVNGKKITLGKTITAHITGRKHAKYTNIKAVKVKKKTYHLKKGKTAIIRASIVLVDKSKKQLTKSHAKEFRYATSNKQIAKVTEKGKIKAVGKGTCTIYVYAKNGYAKKVKVTVK